MIAQLTRLWQVLPNELIVILLGALPISEVRGAIPVALSMKFPWAKAVGLAVFGNMLPVVPVLLFLDPVSKWLSVNFSMFDRFFKWLFARTRKHSDAVEKYEAIGLAIFVGVPLPMTGAWSGCAAAFLFGIRFWRSFWAITAGILIAAAIVALVCLGVINVGDTACRLFLAH